VAAAVADSDRHLARVCPNEHIPTPTRVSTLNLLTSVLAISEDELRHLNCRYYARNGAEDFLQYLLGTGCLAMKTETVSRVCGKCGANISADGRQWVCPVCLLEAGLGLLEDEHHSAADPTPALCRRTGAQIAKMLGDFGDYEWLEEIGRGGQGVVYRAHQKSLNRTVALKVIGLGRWTTEAHLKRFRREAEAAASLDHPCIVPIYKVGERDGSCYISMKFVEGGQLDEVAERQPIPIRHAVELIAKLARTVQYAHQHGILHRDIKPGNILLDAKGEPHLTDFGLARLVETENTITRTLEVMGTPSYMAPCQAAGETRKVSKVTDIYGLGAVLYQLLTGHPPFAGGTTYETIKLVLETEPRHPRLLNPKVDRDLSTICLKCLEKDPRLRYSSALALAEDLEHWLKHEPIRAKRSGVFTHARKWVRRQPAIATLIAALVALAAAMGWNVWKSELFRAAPEKSIAVLPFENLSRDPDNAYFADGVQDEILTNLIRISDLKVISRTSTVQYKSGAARNLRNIGHELGVVYVMEGSVQRAGNRVRVTGQLIDARTDRHLWAQIYDRDLADMFAIQSEIAKAIAEQLQAKLSPREKELIEKVPTTDLVAYDRYLRAQELFADTSDPIHAREKLPQAAHLLEEAVTRDPQFLAAWCLLSRIHGVTYFRGHDHTVARLDQANAAVQAALRLQPDAGEAHLALANYYYHGLRDFERARRELAIAQRTLPNSAEVFRYTGFIDRREGHWEEATRNIERGLELDPRNFFILQQLALAYQWQHLYADEARTYDRVLTIVQADPNSRILRALVAVDWRADIKPFQATLATLVAENPSIAPDIDPPLYALCERTAAAATRTLTNFPREGVVNNGVNYPYTYWEGVVARCQGDSAKARMAFTAARKEVEESVEKQPDFAAVLSLLGTIDAGLGRKEEALREGRRACELLPISKDAIDGGDIAINLAHIYAWTGEKDRAIEQIAAVERVPNSLSYGLLKLHPYWDSLRGDSRFEKIVASLAPKGK